METIEHLNRMMLMVQSMLDAALCIGHLILCAALPQVSYLQPNFPIC